MGKGISKMSPKEYKGLFKSFKKGFKKSEFGF